MGGQGSGRSLVAIRPAICELVQIVAARQFWPPRGSQHIRDRAHSLATGQGGWAQRCMWPEAAAGTLDRVNTSSTFHDRVETRPAPMHNHVPCGATNTTWWQGEEPRLQPVRRERRGREIGSGQVLEDSGGRCRAGTPKVVSRY